MVQRGIPAERIGGGFEWVGWHEFEAALPKALAAGREDDLFGWMKVTPDRFLLAFGPVPRFRVIDRVAYRSRALGRGGHVYSLVLETTSKTGRVDQ